MTSDLFAVHPLGTACILKGLKQCPVLFKAFGRFDFLNDIQQIREKKRSCDAGDSRFFYICLKSCGRQEQLDSFYQIVGVEFSDEDIRLDHIMKPIPSRYSVQPAALPVEHSPRTIS